MIGALFSLIKVGIDVGRYGYALATSTCVLGVGAGWYARKKKYEKTGKMEITAKSTAGLSEEALNKMVEKMVTDSGALTHEEAMTLIERQLAKQLDKIVPQMVEKSLGGAVTTTGKSASPPQA